jgi:hypothetical protein
MSMQRPRPSWRAPEGRAAHPGLWLTAAVLASLLVVEVWQSSHSTELCLDLQQTRTAFVQASARLDYVRAELERRTTRAELTPLADQLGLVPADARQMVALPSEYLADGERGPGSAPAPVLAWAERASRVLVPEATARSRASD